MAADEPLLLGQGGRAEWMGRGQSWRAPLSCPVRLRTPRVPCWDLAEAKGGVTSLCPESVLWPEVGDRAETSLAACYHTATTAYFRSRVRALEVVANEHLTALG